MRLTPRDIHREVLQRDERGEPVMYAVWRGTPHGEESELLGRTERLPRPRWWRTYPADGTFPKPLRGWVNAIAWLIELKPER